MTVTTMNEFLESVLTLHESARQPSQCMLPKVLLKRLSSNTILKYTEKVNEVFRTSEQTHLLTVPPAYKAPFERSTPGFISRPLREDENVHETHKNDMQNDTSAVENSSAAHRNLESQSTESQGSKSDTEDRVTEPILESEETESSYNSDNLPDLNDPSWGKEVKKKKVKMRRKRKKKGTLKAHPKLMERSRKAFQHKSFLYKLSQDFVRGSKATKTIESTESQPHYKDKFDYQQISKDRDHNSSNTAFQLNPNRPAGASLKASPRKSLPTEGSQKSKAEILSLAVKQNLARFTEHEKSNHVSEVVFDSGLESVNTVDTLSSRENEHREEGSEAAFDSGGESDATVVYDPQFCQIESVQSLSEKLADNDEDLTTTAANINTQKRKESPLGISSGEGVKKLKKDQQIVNARNDGSDHPMVVIPLSIKNQQLCRSKGLCSVPGIPGTHKPRQSQTGPVPPCMDNTTGMEEEENSPASVEEEDPLGVTVEAAEIKQRPVRKQVTITNHTYPVPALQEVSTVVDCNTSCESNMSSNNIPAIVSSNRACEGGENPASDICETSSVSGESVNQNEMPSRLNPLTTSPIIREVDNKENNSGASKKVAVSSLEKPIKSLKQMSLQFQELTTKRVELEDKIRQVKEEYNKKLEILEEEKKQYDMDIKKMIDAMSAWKEMTEGDQSSSTSQESADANSTASVGRPASQGTDVCPDTTMPTQTFMDTPVTAATVSSSANSNTGMNSIPEKVSINVIPAANIRNFGAKKPTPKEKLAAPQDGPFPTINVLRMQRTTRVAPKASATVLPSQGSVEDGSSSLVLQTVLQPRSNLTSMLNRPSPPNAVVVPGTQQPVSSHMVCRMPPCQPTSQRRPPVVPVGRPVRASHAGPVHTVHKAPQGTAAQGLLSQMPQNPPYTQVQQQQHYHQQQQQVEQQQQHMQQHQQLQMQQQQLQQQQQIQQQQQQQQQQIQQQQQQMQQHQQQQHQQIQQQQQQMQQHQQQQQQQPQVSLPRIHVVMQPQIEHNMQERQQLLMVKRQYQQQQQQQARQNQQQQHQQQQQLQSQNQQQVSFQAASNTQPAQHHKAQPFVQQYQQGQGQLPSNAVHLQGGSAPGAYSATMNTSNSDSWSNAQVVPNISLASTVTTTPSSKFILTYSKSNNPPIANRDTSTQKAAHMVNTPSTNLSATSITFVPHSLPLTPESGESVIGISLPHNFPVSGSTDRPVSVQAPQAPSSNRSLPTTVVPPAPAPSTLALEETTEPICRMCGLAGIFTCCGDVIYCNTECQRNDWNNHQHHCTNTSPQDGS